MKFFSLISLTVTAFSSLVSAGYYQASRITYYGGPGDEYSTLNPFCQDYASNVPSSVSGIKYYVAMSADILSKSSAKNYCGKTINLSNAENGRNLSAIVVDSCRSCGYGNVDLSVEAFRYLSADKLSKGVLRQVKWCIVDGPDQFACSSSSSSNKTTTRKTTTTKKTTTTSKKTTQKYSSPSSSSSYSYSSSSSTSSSVRKAGGIYVQLEKGSRHGYSSVERRIKYYSGDGYVRFTKASHGSKRTRVEAYVYMKKAGLYNIKVKFNNPNSSSVVNRVVINNNYYSVNFSKTGDSWAKVKLRNIPFKAGKNLVQIRATNGYMSFDYVYIE